jgi:hypothetical protein
VKPTPGDEPDRTILAEDGRVLLFSCERFVADICEGEACFVCGAFPTEKPFNDEHIVPRWVLRRYGLSHKEITLPTGERRRYSGYRVPCCIDCNSLLGERLETPISKLLDGDYATIVGRLDARATDLIFTWLALLFFKIHLKDSAVPMHKDRRKGSAVIGEIYDWQGMHHLHAVARTPYTRAAFLPGVLGSLQIFEMDDEIAEGGYDYMDFTFGQTLAVRLGSIGIVAVLNDAAAAEVSWSDKLAAIDGPINTLQLREVAAMFATANDALLTRPAFGTYVVQKSWVMIFARTPGSIELAEFDPEKFGDALLFALRDRVAAGVIEVDGSREHEHVVKAIRSGHVRFLTDEAGRLRR